MYVYIYLLFFLSHVNVYSGGGKYVQRIGSNPSFALTASCFPFLHFDANARIVHATPRPYQFMMCSFILFRPSVRGGVASIGFIRSPRGQVLVDGCGPYLPGPSVLWFTLCCFSHPPIPLWLWCFCSWQGLYWW